jgi:chromosomal replication initiation ATPase DnaA
MLAVRELKTGTEVLENRKRVSEYFKDLSAAADLREIAKLRQAMGAQQRELENIKFERDQYRAKCQELKIDCEHLRMTVKGLDPTRAAEYCGPVSMERINYEVCEFYGIDLTDLMAEGRHVDVVLPRQVAMYLCLKLAVPRKSTNQIGREFRRDHTTVMNAERKLEKLRKEDADLNSVIEYLESKIRSARKINPVISGE